VEKQQPKMRKQIDREREEKKLLGEEGREQRGGKSCWLRKADSIEEERVAGR